MPRPSPPLSPSLFNSLIASRARAGLAADAFSLLARMLAAGVSPTAFTFSPILSSSSVSPRCAAQLHPHILKNGLLHSDPYSGTALLGFFARNGRFSDALNVFEEMLARSVVTWNCLISWFVQYGRVHDAVFWFRELVRSGDGLSDGSLVAVLPAFGSPEQAQGLVKKIAMDSFSAVANSLLNSYCTCCAMCLAEKLFDELMFRDVVSWNTMITAFARSNSPGRAFELFLSMQGQGVLPNETTFSSVLYACTSINGHDHGQFVHAKAIKRNLNTSVFVNTSLVDFYAKCVGRRDAHKLLEEVPENSTACWNALISGNSDSDVPTPFVILRDMLRSGIRPNEVSFSSLLKDPSLLDLLQIHSLVTRLGYDSNDYVSSALISSYASHGVVSDALAYGVTLDPDSSNVSMNVLAGVYNRACMYQETKELLLHQQSSDTVSWSILITACARNGDYAEAFEFFTQMRFLGHHFDNYVYVSLLSICTKSNSLVLGRLVHGLIIKTNSGCSDTYVHNMLLDMYAKCGRIEDCLKAFEEMEDRNVISWTAVISGLALNGFSRKALAWFKAMEEDGFKPDKVAILAVLSACRHGGLVQEGMDIFKHMKADYGTEAEMEHYICVVDMLCKCGHLKEAESSTKPMAVATTPLAPLALTPPPISASQWSLLLPRCPPAPISLSLRSASPGARLLAAVAANEPELGGGGSEGGGEGPVSGGAGGSGGGGGGESDPQGGGEEGEEKMGEGLSMSQKLTLAYAALVGVGGVMGYMKSGSQKSLAAGGISAMVLYFVHTQLPVSPVFASSVGLGISAALLSVMGSRFKKSGKIFPAGVVSLVSLVMVGGYFHGILRSSHA